MDSVVVLAGAVLVGGVAGYVFGSKDGEKRLKGKAQLAEKIEHPSMQMAFVVRTDLGMSKGKAAAQVCHAALGCYEIAARHDSITVSQWKKEGQQKVVVAANSQEQLLELQKRVMAAGLVCQVIQDAGRTQIDPGSLTVLGIGPAPIDRIEKFTLNLPLF